MRERILIADDERIFRTNLARYLRNKGYFVEDVSDGQQALEKLEGDDFDLILSDIRMPRMTGIELLRQVTAKRPDTAVILMTAFASIDTAIEGFREGAYDYVLKPVALDEVGQKVENVLSKGRLRQELTRLRRELKQRLGFEGIIGDGPAMQRVFDLIDRVAGLPTTVLLTGESGTGKELAARAIHERSEVADKEFLAVNMGAMTQGLLEAQLFGAEKGSYTGADRRRDGIFQAVHGGTVFLDEIGEMPLEAQAKLLRTVEHKEVLPLGASRPIKVDFRLVAATNRDLAKMVEEGKFRQDLYYRLNIFHVELPPLRERREDIPALIEHFAARHARLLRKPSPCFNNEAMKALIGYQWPGNVRELSNVVERALILSPEGRVGLEHLPGNFSADPQNIGTGLRAVVERCEREHIEQVLQIVDGNREEAAKLLEVDPTTLYRRIKKYEIA